MGQIDETLLGRLNRFQQRALIVGIVGLVLAVGGAFLNRPQFFQSYLLGFLFWTQLGLGCLALLMIHHVAGGGWGLVIRRLLEAGMMTLPLMALLFIPIIFGMQELYLWARPEEVAHSAILQHKTPYLNVPFFIIRAVVYFAIWIGLAYLLNWRSRQQDQAAETPSGGPFHRLSGPGIVLFVLTATAASFDWMMSLEPEWFSTIYGFMFMAAAGAVAFAFVIPFVAELSKYEPLSGVVSTRHVSDLGNFLLATVMLWAYMAFSQYLIIWSANLPEEITWYINRTRGGWQTIGLLLIIFHFALPFFVLMSRGVKRNPQRLALVAGLVLFMRLVDLLWLVAPAFHHSGFHLHWLDLVTPIGIGGLWLWLFIRQLKQKALVPVNDPLLQEITKHERHAASASH